MNPTISTCGIGAGYSLCVVHLYLWSCRKFHFWSSASRVWLLQNLPASHSVAYGDYIIATTFIFLQSTIPSCIAQGHDHDSNNWTTSQESWRYWLSLFLDKRMGVPMLHCSQKWFIKAAGYPYLALVPPFKFSDVTFETVCHCGRPPI